MTPKSQVLLGLALMSPADIQSLNNKIVDAEIAALLFVDNKLSRKTLSRLSISSCFDPALITFQSLLSPKALPETSPSNLKLLMDYILADPNSYLVAERCLLGSYFSSISQKINIIETIVQNTLLLIYRYQFDKFVQTNVPHNIDWYVAKVFEFLGIPVFFSRSCHPIDRVQLVSGVTTPRAVPAPYQTTYGEAYSQAKMLINKFSSDYSTALPDYERANIYSRGDSLLSFKSILADLRRISSPSQFFWILMSIYRKYLIYKEYNSCVSLDDCGKPRISFFLHCQPEATTIPAGSSYSVQYNAIKQLSLAYSSSCSVLVREHPSTFRLTFDPRYRWHSYYRNLITLKGVRLVSIVKDVFSEIDRSTLTSTITGNVGFESLCRGVPCLTFADTFYSGLHGTFTVDSVGLSPQLIARISNHKFRFDIFEADLISLLRTTYQLDHALNGSLDALAFLCSYNSLATTIHSKP
jgi:hypothetical protein